ncbi:MAG: tetratricopeptide repeat protein [bacterium]
MTRSRLLILSLLILSLQSVVVLAEEKKVPEGFKLAPSNQQEIDDNTRIKFARDLIRDKNFEGAAALLEIIYEKQPDNNSVISMLRTCYTQMGYYTKEEMLIRKVLETSPDNYINYQFLAEALARQNKTEEALQAYQQAVRLIINVDSSQYLNIVRSMSYHGFESEALNLIKELRTKKNNPKVLSLEAGKISESTRDYKTATLEYFSALDDTSRGGVEAEGRLLNLLANEEAVSVVEKELLAQTGDSPRAKVARLLSVHYLKTGQPDKSYQFARLQDSLDGKKGLAILSHIRSCFERKLYQDAVTAYEKSPPVYADEPMYFEALRIYADALVQLGRYRDAIVVYDSVVAKFPRKQDQSEACYKIGQIYLDNLMDYEAAIKIFDSVIAFHTSGGGYFKSLISLPHCYLRQGDLDEALNKFNMLSELRFNDDALEEINYYRGMIFFYQKNYDSSLAVFNRMLVDFPRGFYLNDALQLIMLMTEASEAPAYLFDYSQALLYEEQRLPDSAKAVLDKIVEDANPLLADISLYKLSLMSLENFDSTSALGYIETMSEQYPDSYYLPFSLKTKAEILLNSPETWEKGKEIYRHLLESYPDYPFISEIRKRLRELEIDTQTG